MAYMYEESSKNHEAHISLYKTHAVDVLLATLHCYVR